MATGACLAFFAACVIAEPPEDPPRIPRFRPTILRDSCVPNPGAILATFPDKFVIPVDLVDPSLTFEWRLYYDYDPVTGNGLIGSGRSQYDPRSAERTIRIIETSQRAPSDLGGCHVIEFAVAVNFMLGPTFGGTLPHTPDKSGGDSVTWFYAPDGDTRGCSVAPDASVTDAAMSEGGDASFDAGGGGG